MRLGLRENATGTTTTVLRNIFDERQEKTETHTPDNEYENFVNAQLESAAECIPTKQKAKPRAPWETLAVRKKRTDLKTASKCNRKNSNNTNALKFKKAQNEFVIKLTTYWERNKMASGGIDLRRQNFNYASNSWRCTFQKPTGNNIICRLYQGLWLNTGRKDLGGVRGLMVIVVGNGHGDASSNPGWDWLQFTLLTNSLPKETVAAIMMLYRNTKVKLRSTDRDTDYYNIVACVQQGDTLAPYLLIICLDYVVRTSIYVINKWFKEAEVTLQKQLPTPTTSMTSVKCTRPSRNPATYSGKTCCKH